MDEDRPKASGRTLVNELEEMLEKAKAGQEEAAVEIENQEEPEAVAPVASKEMVVAAAKATVATLANVIPSGQRRWWLLGRRQP